jgi:hypothetical protein
MPQFAAFFADRLGYGIDIVQAMDANHAADITRARHPEGRTSVVAAEHLGSGDPHELLAEWIRAGAEAEDTCP